MFNVLRRDGREVALTSKPLFDAAGELKAVFHAALATRLAALGFVIERRTGWGGASFEIAGIPKGLCEELSSRRREIEGRREAEAATFREKYGRDPTVVEERELALRCRLPKGSLHGDPTEWWRDLGAAYGVTAESIEALRRSDALPSPAAGRAQLAAELLGADGLTKEQATFTTSELRIAAFQLAAGLVTVADAERVIAELTAAGDLVGVDTDRWTTKGMLELEERVLEWREERRSLRVRPRRGSPSSKRRSLPNRSVAGCGSRRNRWKRWPECSGAGSSR